MIKKKESRENERIEGKETRDNGSLLTNMIVNNV